MFTKVQIANAKDFATIKLDRAEVEAAISVLNRRQFLDTLPGLYKASAALAGAAAGIEQVLYESVGNDFTQYRALVQAGKEALAKEIGRPVA